MSYSNYSIKTMSTYISECPTLTDRESYVVSMRLAGMTLAAIGEKIGVKMERVRQIEAKGMRKLHRVFVRGR